MPPNPLNPQALRREDASAWCSAKTAPQGNQLIREHSREAVYHVESLSCVMARVSAEGHGPYSGIGITPSQRVLPHFIDTCGLCCATLEGNRRRVVPAPVMEPPAPMGYHPV